MPKKIDRTGIRYGRLVAVRETGRDSSNKAMWECVCDCGGISTVSSSSLGSGNTRSCGCLLTEATTKHGGSGKSSYNTWRAMMRRCSNPNDKDYRNYGARGINVCQEWHTYQRFESDMGEPAGMETIDRIDPSLGYFPENCRWASPTVQARNIRKKDVAGVRLRGKKWYGEISINRKKIYSRGCDTPEEALLERKRLIETHWSDG